MQKTTVHFCVTPCYTHKRLWQSTMRDARVAGIITMRGLVPILAETLTLTLTLNPNFGESGFGESGRHPMR